MTAVLRAVYEVFSNPNFRSPANSKASAHFTECGKNLEIYWKRVREEADKNILDE